MKDCCTTQGENSKKDEKMGVHDASCCTPQAEEQKQETMDKKKHDCGC